MAEITDQELLELIDGEEDYRFLKRLRKEKEDIGWREKIFYEEVDEGYYSKVLEIEED